MKKKHIKLIIIAVIAIIIIIFSVIIYKNLFADSNATRNSDLSEYKITTKEKTAVKNVINELDDVNKVDIHTNNDSKIIKIVVKLKKEVSFDKVKEMAKNAISKFSEKNLGYYDIQFFVDTNEESKVYPKIGSKYRLQEEINW